MLDEKQQVNEKCGKPCPYMCTNPGLPRMAGEMEVRMDLVILRG